MKKFFLKRILIVAILFVFNIMFYLPINCKTVNAATTTNLGTFIGVKIDIESNELYTFTDVGSTWSVLDLDPSVTSYTASGNTYECALLVVEEDFVGNDDGYAIWAANDSVLGENNNLASDLTSYKQCCTEDSSSSIADYCLIDILHNCDWSQSQNVFQKNYSSGFTDKCSPGDCDLSVSDTTYKPKKEILCSGNWRVCDAKSCLGDWACDGNGDWTKCPSGTCNAGVCVAAAVCDNDGVDCDPGENISNCPGDCCSKVCDGTCSDPACSGVDPDCADGACGSCTSDPDCVHWICDGSKAINCVDADSVICSSLNGSSCGGGTGTWNCGGCGTSTCSTGYGASCLAGYCSGKLDACDCTCDTSSPPGPNCSGADGWCNPVCGASDPNCVTPPASGYACLSGVNAEDISDGSTTPCTTVCSGAGLVFPGTCDINWTPTNPATSAEDACDCQPGPTCATGDGCVHGCDPYDIDCDCVSDPVAAANTAGLIPCGKKFNDPDTTWNECQPCNLCHMVLSTQLTIEFLVKFSVFLAVLMIVFSGFVYVFAAGNPQIINVAKTMLKYSLIGFAVIFIAWAMVDSILTSFGYIDPLGGDWHTIC